MKKKPKRGRPPLGRKAMTGAQRQARYLATRRKRLAYLERLKCEEQNGRRMSGDYQPAAGYSLARGQLKADGHQFERARREWGFEEGVFIDGAFMDSYEVVQLSKLPADARKKQIVERRYESKSQACFAVESYMSELKVSRAELITYFNQKDENERAREAWAKEYAEGKPC